MSVKNTTGQVFTNHKGSVNAFIEKAKMSQPKFEIKGQLRKAHTHTHTKQVTCHFKNKTHKCGQKYPIK